ncbi:MAG: hydrogenase nickel incorporation protein HypB, partial [Actinobacteria bacterium]|nr:hydrogenase nickel incorporation protein HypB [Actinomycetota bacterium]
MKIEIVENVMQYNKEEAELNRMLFLKNKVLTLNILSAPGAGKTSLIIETIKRLKEDFNIGVIEGDISSTYDAEKLKKIQ